MATTRTFGEGILENNSTATMARTGLSDAEMRAELDAEYFDNDGESDYREEVVDNVRAAGPNGEIDVDQFNYLIHDATVTIENTATGGHRTFKIETLRGNWCTGKRVVALLNGPDNTNAFQNFAFVENGEIKVWSRFRGTKVELSLHEKYARMLENPMHFQARGINYMIAAKCRRCGRKLTTPTSVQTGIGPVCAGRE